MSDTAMFTRFRIEGLHGGPTCIDAAIKDNVLIIVGENGSGKTTFLRIMFYFLSGRWQRLSQFQFKKIFATINGNDYTLKYDDIRKALPNIDDRILRRLPPTQRRRITDAIQSGRFEEAEFMISEYSGRFGYLPPSPQRELPIEKANKSFAFLSDLQERLTSSLGAQILYLPTYRRIERELGSIIQGLDIDDAKKGNAPVVRQPEDAADHIELVEFGMGDVKAAINATLEQIRNFQLHETINLSLSYLGDVVSQSYLSASNNVIIDTSEHTIESLLNRVGDTILSKHNKARLRDILLSSKTVHHTPSEHELILYHYFTKLVKFQSELERKEEKIRTFCEICSEYITDKKFVYESGKFIFKIKSNDQVDVDPSDLSSGEKQIVSLFSHLYLSGKSRFFVLIDEPELSLSVPWQRRFLMDIRKSSFCSGLIAVTHSPFIYDNELRRHTHALGEFVSGQDWGNIQ
jgi:ABC-type lipoprotein export system ATPase subunit